MLPGLELLFAISSTFSVDNGFAAAEVGLPACLIDARSLHPWVLENLIDRGTLRSIKRDHPLEEILELWREDVTPLVLSLGMQPPEHFILFLRENAEELIASARGVERWPLCYRCEKDDACSKDIDLCSFIAHPQVLLWRHERECADLRLEHTRAIASCQRSREAEVSKLQHKVAAQ